MQPQPSAPAYYSLIELAEDGVYNLLKPLETAGFQLAPEVETLPETKDGIDEAVVRPRVTVVYRQSTFGTEERNTFYAGLASPVAQEETLHIDVLVRARGRKSDRGVYAVIEAVRGLLLGCTPFDGARRLWFTGQQIDDFEDRGEWRYMLSVCTQTVIVSQDSQPEAVVAPVVFAWNLPGGN